MFKVLDTIKNNIFIDIKKGFTNLGAIGAAITSNIKDKLRKTNEIITKTHSIIKSNISESIGIQKANLGNIIDITKEGAKLEGWEAIINSALMAFVKNFFKLIGNTTQNPFKVLSQNRNLLKGIKLKLSSAPKMTAIFDWVNEVSSNLLGIKPFAIQEGSADFIDFTKDTVYHRVVQTIVMTFVSVGMFMDSIRQFINYPYNVYLRELYQLELLSLNEYIKIFKMGAITPEVLVSKSKRLGYKESELDNAHEAIKEFLSLNDYIKLFRLGKITEADLNFYSNILNYDKSQTINAQNVMSQFLSLNDYAELNKRRFITDKKLESYSNALNYGADEITNVKNLLLQQLSLTDYIDLFRKEKITDKQLSANSSALGYDDGTLEQVKFLTEFYPSVRDLIDWAVKEAYESDESLFIHGANAIPEAFAREAKKVGLRDADVKRFWHSHWRLLGVSQILEGWHRGIIKDNFKNDYLRRLDYTVQDRKILSGLSFNLLTRVDVRRLFENGLLTTNELFDYYGKLGFSAKDKVRMTILAKQLRFIDMKDLRSHYIEQFENGLLTESSIRSLLSTTGLDSDEISMYIDLSDSNRELEFKLELKKQIEARFYEGIIDYDELISSLRGLGVSNREIERVERNASLYSFRKPKLPTIAELKRYVKKGIIGIQKFVYYALRLGYSTEVIEYIAKDIELIPL